MSLFTLLFHCRSFSPCMVAASISHILIAPIKFSCLLLQLNWSQLFFFLFLALAYFLLSTLMQTLKFSRKKDSAFLLLFSFLSKSPGSHVIYRRNEEVLQMHLSPPDGHVIFVSRCLILTAVNSPSYGWLI